MKETEYYTREQIIDFGEYCSDRTHLQPGFLLTQWKKENSNITLLNKSYEVTDHPSEEIYSC